jgi:hypothetical protein
MRNLGLILVASSFACAAPEGEMGGTETETETDGSGSSSGDGASMTMTSASSDPSMATTAGNTMATTSSPSTTNGSDPDSSSTAGDPDSSSSGGECIPGELGCLCDIGSTCVDALFCVDGVCQDMPACDEPEGEPNDDEASAVDLTDTMCNTVAMAADAGLSGAESDWFTYHGAYGYGCFVDQPSAVVVAAADVAVCMFAACDAGTTTVNCSDGAEESESPEGALGCCGQNEVTLAGFGCSDIVPPPKDATLSVRVTSTDSACQPYELTWR